MCVPVVKSRWRVRHWSAPDRILSTSSPEDSHDVNPEQTTNIEDLTTISSVVEECNMVTNPYLFSSDIEDQMDEITSPVNSCSKTCKEDDLLYFTSPFIMYTTFNGSSKINDGSTSRVKEGIKTRSHETCSPEERIDDAKENTVPYTNNSSFAHGNGIGTVIDELLQSRRRHSSCPSSLEVDNIDMGDHSIIGARSQPLLPAQSMVLMLLLQRRQNLQNISTEFNTARKNVSTARTNTILDGSTIKAPRHLRELRKLKLLFPHYHKNNPRKQNTYHKRHSIANYVPFPFNDSTPPLAHDIHVPDFKNLDLDSCPVEANINRQTILINRATQFEQHNFIQRNHTQSVIDLPLKIPNHGQTVIEQDPDVTTDSPKIQPAIIYQKYVNDGSKNELAMATKMQTSKLVDNSILFQCQMSQLLSNSSQNMDECSSSISQNQNDQLRCLNMIYDRENNKPLIDSTTSTRSNLSSNIDLNQKSNETFVSSLESDTISEPIKYTDCQRILPVKQAEGCDILQSKVIKEEHYNEIRYHGETTEIKNSRITPMIKSSMNYSSYVLNTIVSSVFSEETSKKDMSLEKVSSPDCNQTTMHSGKREFNKAKRYGTKTRKHFWLSPILVSLILSMMTIVTCAQAKDPVCNKSAEIKWYYQFEELEGCSVIEGELIISIIDYEECGIVNEVCKDENQKVVNCTENELLKIEVEKENHKICTGFRDRLISGNLTFPKLREVTDFLVLYSTKHIKSLSTLFPNLTVIRGNRLIKNFALVIYQMPDMEEIGLIGLTHILNGGVRIQYNPSLCYVKDGDGGDDAGSINWSKIMNTKYYTHEDEKAKGRKRIKKEYLVIEGNNLINQCPQICPDNCQYCWNEKHCQILETECPDDNGRSQDNNDQPVCYDRSVGNGQVMRCSGQCLGGCLTKDEENKELKLSDTQDECYSCKNYLSPMKSEQFSKHGNHACWDRCSIGYVSYKDWRCISKSECLKKKYYVNTASDINLEMHYKIYDEKCIMECPVDTKETADGKSCEICDNCPKKCTPDGIISSAQDLKKLIDCTEIEDNLIISSLQLSGGDAWEMLLEGLGKIKIITGSLIISRSAPIVSLDFFKDLEIIQGIHVADLDSGSNESSENKVRTHYALELTENENLRVLFPEGRTRHNGKNVIIQSRQGNKGTPYKGSASIHYNPKLCKKEITKLLEYSNMKDPDPIDISYGTNGDKAICSETKLSLRIDTLHDSCDVYIQNYQEVLSDLEIDTRQLLKYEINYREISKEMYDTKTLSKYEKRDACGESDWKIADHKPNRDGGKEITEVGGVVKVEWKKEQSLLRPLKPFTYYAVYVTTMIVKNVGGKDIEGAQSDIVYFQTLEYTPSEPIDLIVYNDEDPTKIEITWTEPERPNGIIDHYDIVMNLREINEQRIMQRPFCDKKYVVKEFEFKENDNESDENQEDPEDPSGTCSCKTCPGDPVTGNGHTNKERAKINEEHEFVNSLIDEIWSNQNFLPEIVFDTNDDESGREKRDETQDRQKREIASESINSLGPIQVTENQTVEPSTKEPEGNSSEDVMMTLKPGTRKVRTQINRIVNATLNSTTSPINEKNGLREYKLPVDKLRHFGQYQLKIRACHKNEPPLDPLSDRRRCSEYKKLEIQTKRDEDADNIDKIWSVGYDYENANSVSKINEKGENRSIVDPNDKKKENKGEPVFISWTPPQDPNLLIVNYKIKIIYDATSPTSDLSACETAKNFQAANNRYELKQTGTYTVKVQACSLAGCSLKWSDGISVSVAQKSTAYLLYVILIPVLVVVLVITMLATGFIYVKYKASDGTEITPNPWYHHIEDVYIVDDWEVERERVEDLGGGQEMKTKLGGGAFGVVYSGVYDCPQRGKIQIAVKTVKDNQQCRTFLGEAQVMKNFKTAHVVQLIGVVSQGTPPLVLLEMMKNGSLKEYLHSLRASKKQEERRPTETGFLQMALEIADGMAYLSTNKDPNPIVHCDLAARNCLVSDPPVIKIGDFGMAHEVYADYYKKGNPGMMPVRWMAPETLRDGKFSSASDVWSFGVVLWEMVTLAEQPYQGMGNDGAMKYIKNGGTMERPNECSDSIHNLMRKCWTQLPEDRPTFLDICQHLLPHSNQRFQRESFIASTEGRLAIAEQQQSRDTQFNMQDDSINERTQLTNLNTSSYTPSSFTDSQLSTGNGNGNSNGNAGGGRITDNGMPPSMGFQMHNLTSTSSPVSGEDDESTTNGNHNEIIPTTSMHSDINVSLVGNDTRNVTFQTNNANGVLDRNILNRMRRAMRYLRSNRGQNHSSSDHAESPKA